MSILPAAGVFGVSAGVGLGNEQSSVRGLPQQKDGGMTPATIGAVIVFLAVGTVLGWFSQKMYLAHGDVKVARTRLRGGRRTRWRSAVWVVIVSVALVFAFNGLHPGALGGVGCPVPTC